MQNQQQTAEYDDFPDIGEIFDETVNEEAQKKLNQALPVAPLCNCHEPCRRLHVKKPGPNEGKAFYNCARPMNQACKYFIWAQEWADNMHKTEYHGIDGNVKNVKEIQMLQKILQHYEKGNTLLSNYIERNKILTEANRDNGANVRTKTTTNPAKRQRKAQTPVQNQ